MAEEINAQATAEQTAGAQVEGNTEGQAQETSFDELISTKYQSDFDKKVEKALTTARAKWEADKSVELENAKSEAAKLAKMTKDQKDAYEMEKRLGELEAREKEVSKRELKGEAILTLAQEGLPKELSEILDYTDADKCKKSIDAVKTAFNTALQAAVQERLKGSTPKASDGNGEIDGVMAAFYKNNPNLKK